MGDRVYLSITTTRRNSEAIVEEIGDVFDIVGEDNNDIVEMVCEEADMAFDSELTKLAKVGWDFYGHNSSGSNYTAGAFAAYKGKIAWVDIVEGNIAIMASFSTGVPFKSSLNIAKRYIAYRQRLEIKYFGGIL